MKNGLLSLAPIIIILAAWEFSASCAQGALIPPPSTIIRALFFEIDEGGILSDLRISVIRAICGWSAGAFVAVLMGLFTGRNKFAARLISPVLGVLRPLPPVAVIPLVITLWGIDDRGKILSIAFSVFFPVWVSTHAGALLVPQQTVWMASLLFRSKTATTIKVFFPAALPHILEGLRLGASNALIMVYVSELAGASSGLGYRISVSHLAYQTDRMMAALLVLGALGAVADFLLTRSVKYFMPWLSHAYER